MSSAARSRGRIVDRRRLPASSSRKGSAWSVTRSPATRCTPRVRNTGGSNRYASPNAGFRAPDSVMPPTAHPRAPHAIMTWRATTTAQPSRCRRSPYAATAMATMTGARSRPPASCATTFTMRDADRSAKAVRTPQRLESEAPLHASAHPLVPLPGVVALRAARDCAGADAGKRCLHGGPGSRRHPTAPPPGRGTAHGGRTPGLQPRAHARAAGRTFASSLGRAGSMAPGRTVGAAGHLRQSLCGRQSAEGRPAYIRRGWVHEPVRDLEYLAGTEIDPLVVAAAVRDRAGRHSYAHTR